MASNENRTLDNNWASSTTFRWRRNDDDSYSSVVYQDNDPTVASGTVTTPTHSVATVTIASGAALAANASRMWALLVNDSDTTIYVKLGATAVANQGIRLNANGGSLELSAQAGSLYTGAINAIHGGSGNKVLLVTEGV